ncbi:hypothetical protein DLJ48_05240 [Oenococcus sicerae]|uniref:DUF1129 family protein n=1 Tax=Oenococcus sicerae TaxID=2203724 RepID=A0ABX5QMK2_9LACO|nr:hypothetical protein [Oenococcus sicerae]QAS69971.1 hypothetical protein DLJ48_05240 [Oenococcus sicerae]
MRTAELIEKNNHRRSKLNEENEAYYSDLLLYVRLKPLAKDSYQTESVLLEILQDIIDAQSRGISAEEYFGKSPKENANALIESLPNNYFETFKWYLISVLAFIYCAFFPTTIDLRHSYDLGSMLLSATYFLCLISLLVWIIGKGIYSQKKISRKKIIFKRVAQSLAFSVAAAPGFLILLFTKTSFKIRLEGPIGIAVISVLTSIGIILYLREKKQDRKIWLPLVIVIIGYAVLGISTRFPTIGQFLMSEHSTGRITLAIATVALLIIFYILIWLLAKKKRSQSHN